MDTTKNSPHCAFLDRISRKVARESFADFERRMARMRARRFWSRWLLVILAGPALISLAHLFGVLP